MPRTVVLGNGGLHIRKRAEARRLNLAGHRTCPNTCRPSPDVKWTEPLSRQVKHDEIPVRYSCCKAASGRVVEHGFDSYTEKLRQKREEDRGPPRSASP
jgi:hypothetical protein